MARARNRTTGPDESDPDDADPEDARPEDARPTTVSTKRQIEGLDGREKLFSFAGAALSLVMGVVIYLTETHNHHLRLTKGQFTPQTTLVLAVVFGVLLLVVTIIGRRAPIGFVSLFAFLSFGTTSFAVGFPFLALAAWLLYRSYKIQKDAAATAKVALAKRGHVPGPGSKSPAAPARGSARGARPKGPPAPEPNKRYTPKRPPPPALKPSRRDRRAAEAGG